MGFTKDNTKGIMNRELFRLKLSELLGIYHDAPLDTLYRDLLDLEGMVTDGMTGCPEVPPEESVPESVEEIPEEIEMEIVEEKPDDGKEPDLNWLIKDLLEKWTKEPEYPFANKHISSSYFKEKSKEKYTTPKIDDFYKIFH